MSTGATPTIAVTDIETTGLSVENDLILEVGILECDSATLEKRESIRVVIASKETRMWAREALFGDPESRNIPQAMHVENGLANLILNPDPGYAIYVGDVEEADHVLSCWTHDNGLKGRPLVGASVGSLDRPMIQRHLPVLNRSISYRNIDTSSIIGAIGLFNGPLQDRLRQELEETFPPDALHLTLEDAERSVAMLRYTLERVGLATGKLGAMESLL